MAKPSYYPLAPLKHSVEGSPSPFPEQAFKSDSLPLRPTGSNVSLAALRPRKGLPAGHRSLWRTVKTPLTMALLPIVAIAYLAFCYTVHGKVVPVNTYGLYSVTPQHLAAIKGGVTSISIIIISIALFPIYDIISKLKSEEFFRALAAHSHGVPLETINHVSTPTFGYPDMMVALWRHRSSSYYVLGVVASLLVWIVATVAPGILTVDSVLADGGLMAFAIGAVPAQSVLNGTDHGVAFNAKSIADTAASISWAEMELNVQYSFGVANTSEPDYAAFIAPAPADLSTTTSARWLSDVVGINPTCSWASTNLTTPVQASGNSSSLSDSLAVAYLSDFGLDVEITSLDLPFSTAAYVIVKDPSAKVTNHTTQAPPSDGSMVFLLTQCQSGCNSSLGTGIALDLTGLNTNFTLTYNNQTFSMALLACRPNVTIETREVRNDGEGTLTVQPRPAGRQFARQGNLNPIQTSALFSIATMQLSQSGGALTGTLEQYSNVFGSEVAADLLFGLDQLKNQPASQVAFGSSYGTSATFTPASMDHITQAYTKVVQSVAKSYLAGYLGTAYVPGRISQPKLVFASSIPNLAISSAVFALLAVLLVLTNFRPGKEVDFTLANVAAALHGSELPARFAQIQGEQTTSGYGNIDEEAEGDATSDSADGVLQKNRAPRAEPINVSGSHQDVAEMFGDRRIFMQRRTDGSPVLHIG